MLEIKLQPIPNQTISIRLDNSLYDLKIREINNVMMIDITRDGVVLILGSKLVCNVPIIPYAYLAVGNFIFLTSNGDYPFYKNFGVNQNLIYATQAEIEVLRGT